MKNNILLASLKIKTKLLLFLILIYSFSVSAQSTEYFTNDGDGTITFSDNSLVYTLSGSYLKVENFPGYGWNGSASDDWYVDNIDNVMGSAGVVGSITNSGSDFYVHDLYVAPGDATPHISNSGDVIIRGKLDGSTEFTYTLSSGSINTSGAVNNYFTYVDLSSYNTTRIDELEFELTSSLRYLAIDAFQHSAAASAPTVTTSAASSIGINSATLGGNVTSDGGETVTEKGIVYSTSDATPTIAEGATKDANGSGTGSYSESIGSLSANTTYYYNAYAINSEGTSYGTASNFTTLAEPATVTTQAVTSITQTTATGNGNVTGLGNPNPTQHGVCWNTSGTPTTGNSKTEDGAVSATGAFTSSITGLNPNTTYYVRAYVTNTAKTTYGAEVSFTTNPEPATVITQAVSSITQTTATGNGNVTDLGAPNPTQHGVCWNTTGTPTTADAKTEDGAVSATGAFTSSITGLNPNTMYYVRAYATNTAGTTYGAQVSFTTDPESPTVTTQAVTSITQTTATGNGNVTDLGDPNPTQHGVCWNTTGTPTTADAKTEDGAVSATGAFTSSITGLNPNTTYYVRAYATNTAGTTYGAQVSFTTDPESPTVTTQAVSSIAQTTATGNGNVTDLGAPNPTQHGVCWNTTGTPTTADTKTEDGAVSATGAFTSSITGLNPNTTYYVRAYATNTAGTTYGVQVSFTTDPEPATVTTQAVSSITQTSATGNGNVTDLGDPNPTQHGVCWNTTGTPTTADAKTEDGAVSATGAFTSSITGLNPNTTYYVRAYVTNTAGTTYGTQVSFTTDPEPATVTTQAVSSITQTTATGNGNITDLGTPNPTQHGVCWNTTGTPTTSDSKTEDGAVSATGAFTSSITGLNPNTTYYVRAYATNTAGTSYGTQVSFTTDPEPATVTTQAATSITQTTATGNGNVTDLGDPNPTQHGVCWNTTGTPTIADSKTEDGAVAATGAFTSSITGLNPNTTYYVRAYATNTAGTTYGAQVSFTTDPESPTVTTQAVSSIAQTTATGNGNITDLGAPNPTQHGVCWNTTGTPTTADAKTEDGAVSATGAFTSSITGLTPNTMYYVRAYATNTAGTSYGTQVSFTTLGVAPTVTTQAVSSITQTTATGNGNITDLGTPNPTQHGVCWSTSENPTTADDKTEEGAASATGAFTSNITSLNPNTSYYVRAYATNTSGTVYGTQVSFTTDPEPATVTTQAVSSITQTTATGNGNITDLGAPNPTQHGVCWNTTGTPTTADAKTEDGAVSATGAFTSSITGLNLNTTYYVRAYATNTAGTSYGTQVSFTTLGVAPTVTTQAVTDITENTATGNGNITDLGTPNPTQHGVCWSTSENPTSADDKTEEGAASATGAFTSNITSLNPNTSYYVRAYATNTSGTVYGTQVSFTTLAQAPNVVTDSVSGLTPTTVTLYGTVNANNANTTVSFEYGLTDSYGSTITAEESPVTGTSNSVVKAQLTGLNPSTTYHFRVVGENAGGVTNGSDLTFTTLSQDPIVTTNEATSVMQTSAVLNGTVNANDLSTIVTFQYGTTDAYGNTITAVQSPVTGTTNTDVSISLTGLSPNTEYHFRAVGENSSGTVEGSDMIFTTTKYDQTITFNELPDKTTNDDDFDPGATSDLGLEISYESSEQQVATIINNQIHIVGAGTTLIVAYQEGNDTVNVATPVTQELQVTEATGLDNPTLVNLRIFPNPAKEKISVEIKNSAFDQFRLTIIDVNGRVFYKNDLRGTSFEINVNDYPSGLYFVEIKTPDITQRLKLIIE